MLAELKAPGYDYRTVAGLDEALDLTRSRSRMPCWNSMRKTPNLLWSGMVGNRQCWVLTTRRPGWLKRNDPFGANLASVSLAGALSKSMSGPEVRAGKLRAARWSRRRPGRACGRQLDREAVQAGDGLDERKAEAAGRRAAAVEK